jgi:hypothetical protein
LTDLGEQLVRSHGQSQHGSVPHCAGVGSEIVAGQKNRPEGGRCGQQRIPQREAVESLKKHLGDQEVYATEKAGMLHSGGTIGCAVQFDAGNPQQRPLESGQEIALGIDKQNSHWAASFERIRGGGYCCPRRGGSDLLSTSLS